MRKTSTALRMLLLVASIGFVGLCSATAFTFIRSLVTSSVNGTAYLDCNRDGIKDNSEIGFANMTVTLAGRSGVGDTVTMTTTTDASGQYQFVGLVAGTYAVQFGLPSGTSALSYSPQNTGSQVDASGRTAPLSINGTDDLNGVNAGVVDQTAPQIQFTNPAIAAYASGDTVVVECDNLPIMDASWVTVTDNSGRFFAATFADLDSITGVCSRDGYLKILRCVWSASDVCGNSRNVELYIKIIDNKAPTLVNVPVNITVNTASGEVIPNAPSVTATDNCINTSLTVTFNETETNNACGKIITRTWASADDCGNAVSGVQTITVISVPACLNGGNPPSDTFYIGLPGGSNLQTCLDLGGIGRSISNVQHCGTGAQLLSVSPVNGTCIDVNVTTPLSQVSTDTFCALNCTTTGECRNMVLIFNSVARFPPCDVISSRDLATINTANCGDLGCFCLADSVDINTLRNDYTITDNNVAYSGGYRGCNFDTIYSYTYFTVPDMGTRGPYRLDYWQINGTDRSIASFNTIQQLVDSMNVWDPIGNWKIEPTVFTISGGSTRNTYGQMKITRLANRAYGFLELNLGIISNGIQMCVTSGFHSIMFRNNNSGCSDTITVRVACPDSTSGFKPHAVDDVVTTTKNTPITINVLANDTLFGSLSRPLSIIGLPRHGTASVSSNQIVYTPTLDFCGGKDTLRYEICNANGCDTADVFITVDCSTTGGTRLVAVDDRITTAKNTTIRFRPLNNDTIIGTLLALGVVTAPRHGSIGFSGTDSLIYTPNIGYCGLDTMEYRICNTLFICDTATIFITVTCDTSTNNLKPIAVDDFITTQKNTTITVNVMANDQPNGSLSRPLRVITFPTHGSTITQNNQVVYTPDPDYCGSDFFDYEICNAFGCDTARVSVTVTCTTTGGTRLVAIDDRISTPKNTDFGFKPTRNDTIVGTLTELSLITNPKHGGLTFVGLDSLIYKPASNFCGNDTFDYRICNNLGACDTGRVFITVTCGNDTITTARPIAVDDFAQLKKGQMITVNVMGNDILNGALTRIALVQNPRNGISELIFNRIKYTPNPNFCGSNDTLSYEICNSLGCDTALVVYEVSCDTTTALKPDAIDDVATTKKNQSVTISVLNNDILNGLLTGPVRIVGTPRRGSATVTNNQINYTPQLNFCGGNDTLSYEICNITGCDTAQVVVTITCDTVTPTRLVAVDDRIATRKNTTIRFRPINNDTLIGTLLAVGVVTAPRHGSIGFSGVDSLIYTPNAGYCGLDTMEYRICNTDFICDTATIFITITCDTIPTVKPDAIDDVASTKKNQSVTIGVLNNDVLNGPLTGAVRIIGTPKRGSATVVNNQIVYKPNLNVCGVNDTLSYEICNAIGCDTAKVVVTITCDSLPDLRPIVAVDDRLTMVNNTSLTFRPTINDTIRTKLMALSIVAMPRHGTISFTGLDTLVYKPNQDYCGNDTLEYRICDTAFNCANAFVYINITCDNLPMLKPVAVNDLDSVLVNRLIILNVLRNDTLNGNLVGPLSIITQPTFGTVTVNGDGTITYKPFAGFCGANDVFSYRICNAIGCDTATVTMKVICDATVLNKPPVAVPDVVTTTKNKPIRIIILANDTLNGRLDSIKIISSPLLGTAILGSDNVITYTPDSCGFTDQLIYRICNQNGCDTALVTITVTCDTTALRKPVAVNDSIITGKNISALINVVANDSLFGAPLDTVYIFRDPIRGFALIEGTQIRYLPQTDSCAYRDTFSYIICTRAGCDTAEVVVNIVCNVDSFLKPVATFDTARTKTNQPITINVTRNDTLRGADTFRITRIPQNGISVFDSLRRIIYTPSRSFCGNDTLIYEICNRIGCDTAIVTIKIDCLPPVAIDDSARTLYNQNVTIPIVLNDTLNGADSITVITSATKGLVTILIDKTATYTPDINFCGKDSFQYVLCNRFGCDSAWVRIDVSCGDTLLIFNAISPNQDGKNDGFYLRGIENYPDNEVVVFNRWGNEVYRKKGYRNDEAWQGTWNDKTLPDGTYYYQIMLNDSTGKKYTGYLQIMK